MKLFKCTVVFVYMKKWARRQYLKRTNRCEWNGLLHANRNQFESVAARNPLLCLKKTESFNREL